MAFGFGLAFPHGGMFIWTGALLPGFLLIEDASFMLLEDAGRIQKEN